jgi:hypothetical protein
LGAEVMYVVVDFYQYHQVVKCHSRIGRNLSKLQKEFLSWLHDKNIDHPYWVYKDGEKFGVSFNANALVFWLNTHRFNKRSRIVAKIVEANDIVPKKRIFF